MKVPFMNVSFVSCSYNGSWRACRVKKSRFLKMMDNLLQIEGVLPVIEHLFDTKFPLLWPPRGCNAVIIFARKKRIGGEGDGPGLAVTNTACRFSICCHTRPSFLWIVRHFLQ